MHPQRRVEGLIVRELAGEVVVYDLERHQAHCLNPAAALVFGHCDGRTGVDELSQTVQNELGSPVDESFVRLALDELERAQLLEDSRARSGGRRAVSRRMLLRRVGLAGAAAVPLVTSLLAPTPSQAAATCVTSCGGQPDGTPCGLGCFGTCSGGTCQ